SFFFNAPAPTEIYTLSLHDALPIFELLGQPAPVEVDRVPGDVVRRPQAGLPVLAGCADGAAVDQPQVARGEGRIGEALTKRGKRSEEHTSELQSRSDLVCRLLLEKK